MEEMGDAGRSEELLGAEDLVEAARMIVMRFSGSGASFCGLVSAFVDGLLSSLG
jgi:hypothetical protein